MPWCAGCDRFLSPSTVTPTGECPRCGAPVDPGRGRAPGAGPSAIGVGTPPEMGAVVEAPATEPTVDGDAPLPIPWHFKLLVGAIALYLGWRAFQGIEWLFGRF